MARAIIPPQTPRTKPVTIWPWMRSWAALIKGTPGTSNKTAEASANCEKHSQPIENPYIGCAACNAERPGLSLFAQALEDLDD